MINAGWYNITIDSTASVSLCAIRTIARRQLRRFNDISRITRAALSGHRLRSAYLSNLLKPSDTVHPTLPLANGPSYSRHLDKDIYHRRTRDNASIAGVPRQQSSVVTCRRFKRWSQ